MRTAAVIQAAGKGSRFHSEEYKLLTNVDGKPMIVRTIETALEAGFDEVVVVIGFHAPEMRRALVDYPVKIIENKEWVNGQSTSLSTGVRAVRDSSDRACLMLGDQPFLTTETILAMMAESDVYPEEIIVPFCNGKRGNPIMVPASRYDLLLNLTKGDMGGKQLLITVGYHALIVEDSGILRDIDTVEEMKKYE